MELLCSSQRGICEVPGAKKGTKGAEVDQGYKLPLFLLFYFKCHFLKKKQRRVPVSRAQKNRLRGGKESSRA